jgi:hypothetical protein
MLFDFWFKPEIYGCEEPNQSCPWIRRTNDSCHSARLCCSYLQRSQTLRRCHWGRSYTVCGKTHSHVCTELCSRLTCEQRWSNKLQKDASNGKCNQYHNNLILKYALVLVGELIFILWHSRMNAKLGGINYFPVSKAMTSFSSERTMVIGKSNRNSILYYVITNFASRRGRQSSWAWEFASIRRCLGCISGSPCKSICCVYPSSSLASWNDRRYWEHVWGECTTITSSCRLLIYCFLGCSCSFRTVEQCFTS